MTWNPSKNDTLNQSWLNVGPAGPTLNQHCFNVSCLLESKYPGCGMPAGTRHNINPKNMQVYVNHSVSDYGKVGDAHIPANTTHWNKVGLMLGHRLRRWPNIKPTWFQCVLFAGWYMASQGILYNTSHRFLAKWHYVIINSRPSTKLFVCAPVLNIDSSDYAQPNFRGHVWFKNQTKLSVLDWQIMNTLTLVLLGPYILEISQNWITWLLVNA